MDLKKNVLAQAEYSNLEFGFQGDISDKQIDVDVGFGKVGTIFLRLPPRKHVVKIELTTVVENDSVYYPVVILLDKDFNWISIFEKGDLSLRQRGISKAVSTSQIKISPFVKYLVITTQSQRLGDQVQYQKTESKRSEFTGSINQPEYSLYTIQHTARYSATPHLELLMPGKNEAKAVRKQTGVLLEAGIAIGHETTALGTDGDNDKVGSGTLYGFGYAIKTKHWKNLSYRISAGLREQGGTGRNEAIYAQLLALKEFAHYNLGMGIYADIQNSITTADNTEYNFDDAYGLQFSAEWRITTHTNIAGKYLMIKYADNQGRHYNGNQFLLQMQFFN